MLFKVQARLQLRAQECIDDDTAFQMQPKAHLSDGKG